MMKKYITLLIIVLLMGTTNAYAWMCPECNNEMNSKFCTECGTKQPENSCVSCGTSFGASSPKFCSECGAKVVTDNDNATIQQTASAEGMFSDVKVTITKNKDGTIATIIVDISGETKGIATPCAEEAFLSQFIGKAGPFTEVDMVTGATSTSNAVLEAVNSLFPAEEVVVPAETETIITEYTHFPFSCDEGMSTFNSLCQSLYNDGTLSTLYSVEESLVSEIGNTYMIKKDGTFIDSILAFDKNDGSGSIECICVSYSDISKVVTNADKVNMVMIAMMLADRTLSFSDADALGIAVMTSPNHMTIRNGYEYSYDGNHIWEIKKLRPSDMLANPHPNTSQVEFTFINHNDFSQFWHNGVYRCGTDCDPGDYYIMSLYGAGALYDVEDSPNTFSWSQHRVFRKVHIKAGQYIKISHDAIMVPVSEIDEHAWKEYGVYWVGKDISAGEYKVESITDEYYTNLRHSTGIRGAYQICESLPDGSLISCSPLWNKQTYITLSDGQCIIINNARLTLVE